jgi:hypothetical protein
MVIVRKMLKYYIYILIETKRHDTRIQHLIEDRGMLLIRTCMLYTSYTSSSCIIHAGHFKFESYAVVMGSLAIMAMWPFHFTTYVMVMVGNRFKRWRYRCHHIRYALWRASVAGRICVPDGKYHLMTCNGTVTLSGDHYRSMASWIFAGTVLKMRSSGRLQLPPI